MINWLLFRRSSVSHKQLDSLPVLFKSLNVELVLVGGDLSSTSLLAEFETARKFFSKIDAPKLFTPGNHDQYTKGSHRQKRFFTFFSNQRKIIEHPLEFFTLKDHGVEVHRLANSWWCVLLDTAPPTSITSSNGLFSQELEKYLEEVLNTFSSEDRLIVLNHFPFFENDPSLHRLIGARRLSKLIERHPNVYMYLHGHTHRHSIADLRPNNLPIILDSGCPIQKPEGTWNLIDLSDEGCRIRGYHWNKKEWQVFKESSFQWKRSQRKCDGKSLV